MKIWLSASVFVILSITAAFAADLDARYKKMGEMNVTTGDQTYEMVIPWDTKRGRGYAKEKNRAGQRYITIAGGDVTDSGKPGPTQFSVSFMLIGGNPIVSDTSFRVGGSEPRRFSLFGDAASSRFAEFEISENGEIKARLEATLVEMAPGATTRIEVLEGAAPISLDTMISVSLAEPE